MTLGTLASPPTCYYRPDPVYIIPYEMTAEKLLKTLGITTKLYIQGKEVEKDQIIGHYEQFS